MPIEEFFGSPVATRTIGAYTMSLRAYDEETRLPLHAHGESFATFVLAGGFREESPGSSHVCAASSVVVHAPGDRHTNHFGGRTTCLTIQGGAFRRNAFLATPSVASIALKAQDEFHRPDTFSPMVIEALMLELFVAAERQPADRSAPSWLAHVRAMVERRFQEPLTLRELAEEAGVEPSRLAHAFRRHYGATVGERLRELRVRYAIQRIHSSAALNQIALDAGFSDQSHFTRTFRRATGMTPAAFRRAAGGS